MATTAEDILELAYSHLGDVSPEEIVADPTEGIGLLNRSLTGLFAFGSTINPIFFGAQTGPVSYSAPGWARPANADSIFRIELTTGVEVIVVPFDDRAIETGSPAVYELGQVFRSAGNPLDPTSADSLYFFHSRRPATVTLLTDVLDSLWPEAFNGLLSRELAIYIAMKNDTTMDLSVLKTLRDEDAKLFASFLGRATLNVTRRRSAARLGIAAQAMSLLAGAA